MSVKESQKKIRKQSELKRKTYRNRMCVCERAREGQTDKRWKRGRDKERYERATRYREEGRKREIEGGGNEEETGDE